MDANNATSEEEKRHILSVESQSPHTVSTSLFQLVCIYSNSMLISMLDGRGRKEKVQQ